jgi:hypothetical protein
MAEDLNLPEWMERALGRISLLLVFFGGVAFALGVAALWGAIKPEFSPLYLLLGGPAAVGIGIGLYFRQIWAILLALGVCLVLTNMGGYSVADDLRAGKLNLKSMGFGVFLTVCDLALLVLLVKVVAVRRWAGAPDRVFAVEGMGPGLQCRVRISGETVVIPVPRKLAQEADQIEPGDEVRIEGPMRGKYRVLGFYHQRA